MAQCPCLPRGEHPEPGILGKSRVYNWSGKGTQIGYRKTANKLSSLTFSPPSKRVDDL